MRVRVGGGWGFAATRDVTRAGARGRAGPRARPRRGAARVAPDRARWRPSRPRAGTGHRPTRSTRSPRRSRTSSSCCSPPRPRCARRRAPRADGRRRAARARERKAFASTEGAACTQETASCGARASSPYATDGSELQVRSYPDRPRRRTVRRRRAGSTSSPSTSPATPRAWPRRRSRCSRAPPCPTGTEHDRAARRAGGAPGARVDRARARARPHPARRGLLRGHELGRRPTTWARCATAPSCCTSPPTRRSPAAWAPSAGTTRASPPCAPTSSRAASCAAPCPTARAPRPIGPRRLGRLRARRRLRAPADRAHDQRLARARDRAGTLADLIADTDDGLYLETNRSWSIDDRRLQFQFATELCREIRGGELGRLYRNGSYAGVTPRFWGSLDAVCGPDEWRLWGLTNCGKGEPGQIMVVSHGAAPARFRDVQVGVA